ncbi:MAG: hypothetical protein Kow00124_25630 [Anaerolineae bacterium]
MAYTLTRYPGEPILYFRLDAPFSFQDELPQITEIIRRVARQTEGPLAVIQDMRGLNGHPRPLLEQAAAGLAAPPGVERELLHTVLVGALNTPPAQVVCPVVRSPDEALARARASLTTTGAARSGRRQEGHHDQDRDQLGGQSAAGADPAA